MIHHLFTSHQNHDIGLPQAIQYLDNISRIKDAPFNDGVFFDKPSVANLLDQPKASGLHYYYGKNQSNLDELILVPTTLDQGHIIQPNTVLCSMAEMPCTNDGGYDLVAVNHGLSPVAAGLKTQAYRRQRPLKQPQAGFFGANALRKVLQQPGAIGLQYLFGANEDGIRNIIVAGVTAGGEIMMDQILIEMSLLCPPFCLWDNLLNSDAHLAAALRKDYSLISPAELEGLAA